MSTPQVPKSLKTQNVETVVCLQCGVNMRFNPSPGTELEIGAYRYQISQHPASKMEAAYAQEAGKATVYQVRQLSESSPLFALKVFKKDFRGAYVIASAERIRRYQHLPGMFGCERIILTRELCSKLLRQYPELEYSVLMPWLGTESWFDVISKKESLTFWEGLRLATHLSKCLHKLEHEGVAHCDISGGNVLIDRYQLKIELIDLEDLFGPNIPSPTGYPMGTLGYQHRSSPKNIFGQWLLEGDRFSAAVLLAEMLTWHDEKSENQLTENIILTHVKCTRIVVVIKNCVVHSPQFLQNSQSF